jgi:hypothetical protein
MHEFKEEECFNEFKKEESLGGKEEEEEEVPVTLSPAQHSRRVHRHRRFLESSNQNRYSPPSKHTDADCECKEEDVRSPVPGLARFKPGVTPDSSAGMSPRLRLKEAIRLDKEVAKQYFQLKSKKLPEELAEKMRERC